MDSTLDRSAPGRPEDARPLPDILLVEDEPAEIYLFRHGCATSPQPVALHSVTSVGQALAFLRHDEPCRQAPRPQLIVTSINLRPKLGFDLIAEVKGDPALRPIPLIVLSHYNDPAVIQQSYELGANSYIIKPTGLDAFFGAIHGMVGYWLKLAFLSPP